MTIKWKNNKNLKPDVVLARINSSKRVDADKKVSFVGFEYHETRATVLTMIDFPRNMDVLLRERFLSMAISEVSKDSDLNSTNLMTELNRQYITHSANKEQKFALLTSISLAKPIPFANLSIDKAEIKFIPGDYPKKYLGRDESFYRHGKSNFGKSTPNYANVIVYVKAKSPYEAVHKSLRAIDIHRAVWSLLINPSMELMGDSWKPINIVRLGEVHTIHSENGRDATETFWFEPNFSIAPLYQFTDKKTLTNIRWILDKLTKSKFSNLLKEALLKYVRALDERDHNLALIRLWGALESLTVFPGENYDLVIRRCAFLFLDRPYHEQVLEHLREYRNSNVHAGEDSINSKTYCYQLQYYFFNLIQFYLNNNQGFDSLEEVHQFLDFPTDKSILEKRKELIEKALKFIP